MRKALRRIKGKKASEKGAILIVALLVGIAMLIMTTPFLFRYSNLFRDTEKSNRELSAFNLAEAGVERGIWSTSFPWGLTDWEARNEEATWLSLTLPDFEAADGTIVGNIEANLFPPYDTGSGGVDRILEGTGRVPFIASRTVDRIVRVVMEQYFKSIWDFGIFAHHHFYSKTNIGTDSYDSSIGGYGETIDGEVNIGNQGHVGTNSHSDGSIDWDGDDIIDVDQGIEIDQGQSSDILGNLTAGPGARNSDLDLNDIIDLPGDDPDWLVGNRGILNDEYYFPSIDLMDMPPYPGNPNPSPDDENMFADADFNFTKWFDPGTTEAIFSPINPFVDAIVVPGGIINNDYLKDDFVSVTGKGQNKVLRDTLYSTDSGVYDSFIIEKQTDVTIPAGEHVAIFVTNYEGENDSGTFFMDVGSNLNIEEGASLTLILGDASFETMNNTITNESMIPSTLMVLGTDEFIGDMYWNNNVDTYAAIYAPRANVYYESNVDLYGAILSNSIEIKNNVNLHYDEALKKILWLEGGVPFWAAKSWQQPFNATVVEE